MHRRLALATFFVCLVTPLFSAYAQSCPPPAPPPISLQNAEICAGSTDHAWTTSGLASYVWSATHGSIVSSDAAGNVTFSSDGTGDVALSVTATDYNGCANSNTVTVPLHTLTAPALTPQYLDMCPTGQNSVTVAPPAPSGPGWTSITWSVSHATITSGGGAQRVYLTADNSGQPVVATVDVIDEQGCAAQSSVTIPIRVITAPSMSVQYPDMCPGGQNSAMISQPSGPPWQNITWSIQNGTILSGAASQYVNFAADNSGLAVVLRATVQDENGCSAQTANTIPVNALGTPLIELYQASVCPGARGDAQVPNSPDPNIHYSAYQWTVEHGTATYSTNQQWFEYIATGDAPVVLHVTVTDDHGCTAQNSVSVPIRTLAPPSIDLYQTSVCPGARGDAQVPNSPDPNVHYSAFQWTVEHGTASYSSDQQWFEYIATGDAPVVLHVTVTDDQGCTSQNTRTVPIRSIAAPTIQLYSSNICAGGRGDAQVASPGDPTVHYTAYQWSVQHGTATYSTNQQWFEFIPAGDAPVVLTVTVTDDQGCSATSSMTVPLVDATPQLSVVPTSVQAGTSGMVRSTAPQGVRYNSVLWSITGGTINYSYDTQASFTADGSGPLTISITVTTDSGCSVTASVTLPLGTPDYGIDAPANICSGGSGSASVQPQNANATAAWEIANGTLDYVSGMYTQFHASGAGPVVLTAHVTDANGTHDATKTIPLLEPVINVAANPTYCASYPLSFSVYDPSIVSTTWAIENGTIVYQYNSTSIQVQAIDPALPVKATATMTTVTGCTVVSTGISNPTPLVLPALQFSPQPFCTNQTGSVTVTNAQSFGGYYATYSWSITGGSFGYNYIDQHTSGVNFYSDGHSPTIDVTVTVQPPNGCPSTSHIAIPYNALTPEPSISATGALCGYIGGSVTLTASDGATSYHWSNGATTQSITVTEANYYSVEMTYANGCDVTAYRQVQRSNPPFIFNNGGVIPVNGSLSLWASTDYYPRSYLWSNGATTQAIQVTQPGTYTVTVENFDGCILSASTTITASCPSAPTISASGPTTFCNGGSVTLSIPGTWSTYSWSNGATTPTITVSSAGNYSATVTNSNGCSLQAAAVAVTVNTPATPTITANGPTTFCAGGSVTLTASAASSYLWSNGQTTASITVNAAGSYSVTTTDANGCTATSTATIITVNSAATPTITANGPTTFCAGGSVTLTASAASSYLWSNGATTASITVNAGGSYSVTTTDANGCRATSAATSVTVNTAATPTISASGPATFCAGGSVTLTASAASSYLWSNGATSQSITVNAAGSYSVTITDANGCSATSAATAVTVNSTSTPAITADGPTTFCANLSVGFTASAGSAYLWSTGATTRAIRAYTTGDYSVTVTDANGCAATSAPVHVEALPLPVPTVTGIPASICQGATGHASVAETFTSYAWSSVNATLVGPTNGQSVDFVAGTPQSCAIFLSVTGSDGCSWSYSYNMSVQGAPNPDLLASPSECLNGLHVANVWQPAAGSTFAWSITNGTIVSIENYDQTPNPNGPVLHYNALAAGQTVITVTETNTTGCTKTVSRTVTITQPTPMDFTVAAVCPGATGTAHSVNNYDSYYWTITNGTILSGANAHDVTFQASSDPANPTTLTLDAPLSGACVSPVTKTVPWTVIGNPQVLGSNSVCPSGTGNESVSGSYSSFAWSISNGTITNGANASTVFFTAGTSGSVTLTLTVTAGGCSNTSTKTVPIEDTTPPAITAPDTICYLGTFTASVPAGYDTYAWNYNNATLVSGGTPGRSIMLRSDGTGRPIDLTVTMWRNSGAGCQVVARKTVSYAATPTPAIGLNVPANFCTGMTGQANVTNGPFATYAWTITGGTISGPTDGQTISFIPDGSGNTSVSVTVTDGRGNCTANNSQYVTQANFRPFIGASNGLNFCAGSSTTLTASSGADSYLWSTGATSAAITVTAPGDYTVTTTKNGCSFSSTVTVTTYPVSASVSADKTAYCANESAATLTVTATGFTGVSRFIHWYATDSPFSLGAGNTLTASNFTRTYYAVVSDEKGCSAQSNNITITVRPLPSATISASGPTTFCAGGSVTLTASSGASYLWSTGATTQAITVSSAGSYTVAVTNAAGCSATSAATNVTVNSLAAPTITFDKADFCPESNVTALVPAGYVSYAWSVSTGSVSGQGTNSILIQIPGTDPLTVSVTVTDANGCSATRSATLPVRNFAKPTVSVDVTQVCAGGTAHATVTNGPYSAYSWSVVNGTVVSGDGTSQITFTPNGGGLMTVHVIGSGADNCVASSDDISVAVNTPPTPTITADGPTTFCPGSKVTLTSSSANAYLWSTGAISQSITVNAAGNYTVTTTDANGCSATSSATSVSIDPALGQPTAAAQGPTSICPGGSVTMTATGNGGNGVYSYQWYNINGPISGATSQTYTASPASNQYYYAVVSDSIGCSSAASNAIVVTVNPSPNATMTAPTAVCAGATSEASVADAGAGATYAWTVTGGTLQYTMANGAVAFFHSDPGASSVVVHVTVTAAAGCSAASQSTVAVNPLPNATITPSGPTTFCASGSVTLTAPAGMSVYSWSDGSNGASLVVTATGTYHVTVTDANGCSAQSSDVAVTVNSNPAPAITAPNAICSGTSGNASTAAVSGATYAWTISGGTITSGSGTNAITFTATSGPVSLGVTVTNSNGCSGSASASVGVNALPDATITAPATICSGTSASASVAAVAGGSYAWTISGGTITGGSGTSSITFTSTTGPVSLGVTVTTAASCSASSSKNVLVNALPDATITAPASICSGTSGSASVAAVSGGNYAWTISGGTITGGSGTSSITFTSTTGPVSLGVTVTTAASCSASSSKNVTVNALPDATITAPASICSGTSGSASVAAVSGGSYAWTISGGTITGGSGTSSITFTSTTGPVSLGVTVTTAASCSASSSKNVTINALPNATITAPSGFCSGTTATASVPAVSGGSYAWTITGGTITGGSGTNSITFTSTGTTVGLGVTVTNANNCSSSSSANVAVNANPATPTISAGGPTTFCAGGSVTLTAPASASYHWSTGETTQSIAATSTASYTVWVTNASGCASPTSAATSVTVNPATAITQQPASITIPHNTTTTLSVTATGTGTLTYQWYNPPTPSNTDTSKRVGTNSPTFTTPKLGHGTFYYYVVVTGSCGTVRSAVATVTSN